jgi:hypothetical protein
MLATDVNAVDSAGPGLDPDRARLVAFETLRQLLHEDPFLRRDMDAAQGPIARATSGRATAEATRLAPSFLRSPLPANEDVHARAMGLWLSEPVFVDVVDHVRLPYLRRSARIAGEPIDAVIDSVVPDSGGLETSQSLWDDAREKLADARHDLAAHVSRLESMWRQDDGDAGPLSNRHPANSSERQRLVDAVTARMGDVARTEREIREHGPLHTRRNDFNLLADRLAARHVTWDRLELDGLLGEFHPVDRTITIYANMIRILAGHPKLRALGAPRSDVEGALRRIALLHEMAHAYLVYGADCDGACWHGYHNASQSLHESLATEYTHRLAREDGSLVRAVWETLEPLLPSEYRADGLPASGEQLRAFVVMARTGQVVQGPASVLFEGAPIGRRSMRLNPARMKSNPAAATVKDFRYRSDAVPPAPAAQGHTNVGTQQHAPAPIGAFRP